MHFVGLVLFSLLCSFTFGYGGHYKELRQRAVSDDEAIDDIADDDEERIGTLSTENAVDDNEGMADVNDREGNDDGVLDIDENDDDLAKIDDEGVNDENDNGIDDADDFNDETIKDDAVNDDAVNDNADNGDAVDDDAVNDDAVNDDAVNDDAVNNAAVNDHADKIKKLNLGNDELDVEQYKKELAAADWSAFLGSNAHNKIPNYYKDLSRRFVPVYPYKKEKRVNHRKPDIDDIIKFILSDKSALRNTEEKNVVPIMAPPDVVLAVMRNGTRKYSAIPSEETERVIRQQMLRSGDYWDNVWKEEVNPVSSLRSKKVNKKIWPDSHENTKPFKAKLVHGTKLYDLLGGIVKKSPKLVYIIST